MRARMSWQHWVWTSGLCATALLVLGLPANAQTFNVLYPVKFVCGFQAGNVPPLASTLTSGYEALKPGNYATTINVFHHRLRDDSLQAWAVTERSTSTAPVSTWSVVRTFNGLKVDCPDIVRQLGLPLTGPVVEGWLVLFSTADSFRVTAVYTYSSQNFFVDHRLYQVANGQAQRLSAPGASPTNPSSPSINFPPVPLPGPGGTASVPFQLLPGVPAPNAVVGTGAGGLGLGASIEVETVAPVMIDPVLASDLPGLLKFVAGDLG